MGRRRGKQDVLIAAKVDTIACHLADGMRAMVRHSLRCVWVQEPAPAFASLTAV
jgi:hypothetical protein